MIFEAKIVSIVRVNTDDYKEYDGEGELSRSYDTPEEVVELLRRLWDEGGLDIAELLDDPDTLEIEVNYA